MNGRSCKNYEDEDINTSENDREGDVEESDEGEDVTENDEPDAEGPAKEGDPEETNETNDKPPHIYFNVKRNGTTIVSNGDMTNDSVVVVHPTVPEVAGDPIKAILTETAQTLFRYSPFIVLESELEITEDAANMFFKRMGLGTDINENKERKMDLWINKKYKDELRKKHQRQRNNISQKIHRMMESKYAARNI